MRLLYVSRSSVGHDRRFLAAWTHSGVDVVSAVVGGAYDARSELIVRNLIETHRPDIIQVGPLTDPGYAVARVWSGPLIVTSWGFDLMDEVERDDATRERARFVLAASNLLFVDSNATFERAVLLGAKQEHIVQFPWGVDSEWFGAREIPPLENGESITFLCTRRHEPIYRVGDIVNAFLPVAREHRNVQLRLVGTGSLTQQFKSAVGKAGLTDRVQFDGEVSHSLLPAVYRSADVYITASSVDGTSVSLLEAMASGTPVVASRIEGNAQWISDKTGFSFDVGDEFKISELLEAFAKMSPDLVGLAKERAERARDLVSSRADWKQTVECFPEYWRRAVEYWLGAQSSASSG